MLMRRKSSGRARPAAEQVDEIQQLPTWVTPTVHTLLDLAPLPAAGGPAKPAARAVVREWDLLGYGVIMTVDGVLHALDAVAYRTWQLHKEARPADEVALLLATEWDVEIEHARRDVTAVLTRLQETVDASTEA
jgi:hypothetical protein